MSRGTEPGLEQVKECILCAAKQLQVIDAERNLCRCGTCGLVFDNPRPTMNALREYYSGREKYDEWLRHEHERENLWKRRLGKISIGTHRGSLLDIGAGTGQFLHAARSRFAKVQGTELSVRACTIARERYGIALLEGDVASIDFKGERFDVVTLFHVLEHVPYPGIFLGQVKELLSPGGSLFIAVPNELFSLRCRAKALVKRALKGIGIRRFKMYGAYGFSKIAFGALHDEVHLSHFSTGTLCAALKRQGFTIVGRSLDPFFVAAGPRRWFETAYYYSLSALHRLYGINIYDTLWIEARR
jgi:2-polyprenyl-3-methyl-5-hydroxy-6-metoxy-1,4-benzoquinol methylase